MGDDSPDFGLGCAWPPEQPYGDHQGVDPVKVKLRSSTAFVAVLTALVIAGLFVPAASAAGPVVTGGLSGDPVNPGEPATLTFTISPSQRTLASFSLTPPDNWQLVAGSPSPGAPAFQVVDNTLVASGLSVSPSGSATVQFGVKTGCVSGNWTWGLVARDTQGRAYGNGASDLTTNVNAHCALVITNQPTDALKNTLITGTAFDASANPVTVELRNGSDQLVPYFPVGVTFEQATGAGLASGTLNAATKTTVGGVATFSGAASTLSIGTTNEPQFTDYKLKPKTVGTYVGLVGDNSTGFDIWETMCSGTSCEVKIRDLRDVYKTSANDVLTASTLPSSVLPNILCAGQTLIFANDVFVHQTNGTSPVFLVSHVTRQNMKAVASNGQAHVDWCVGLKSPEDWAASGGSFVEQDTNGAALGGVLYVGFAPACPQANPSAFAPCIVSQTGDGNGGNITTGWLPGGDPPRRT
jgi:hypothetical protein